MPGVARVRIGRVRLKATGNVVPFPVRLPANPLADELRYWLDETLDADAPADAFVAVSIWTNPEDPAWPLFRVTWQSVSADLPLRLLIPLSSVIIKQRFAEACAQG